MEGVYLAQPVFIPRPISPLNFEPFECRPEDVLLPGSSDDDSPDTRARKKRRREQIGTDYLRKQAGYTITFALKGPFEHGWRNPWKEYGVVVDAGAVQDLKKRAKLKLVGKRASSPIDLTSEPEEGSSDGQLRPTKERGRVVRNGNKHWLTSNIQAVQQRVSESADGGSPTPARRRHIPGPARDRAEKTRRSPHQGREGRVISEGDKLSPVAPQARLGSAPLPPDHGYGLEQYYKQLMEEGEMPRGRSPSEELDQLSQEKYQRDDESSIAYHLRRFDTLSHDNLLRLEETTVRNNVAIIKDQVDLVHSVAEDRKQLLLQKSVLRRYISDVIENLLHIEDLPDEDLYRPRKRSRNEVRSLPGGPSSPIGSQKRQKLSNDEERHEKRHKILPGLVPRTDVGILRTSSPPQLDTANLTREQKGKAKAEDYGIQNRVVQGQSQSPPISNDSFKTSSQTSLQSPGGQGMSKAARKRRRKREEKLKMELEMEVSKETQQGNVQSTSTKNTKTSIESRERVEQLDRRPLSPEVEVGVTDHKRKFESIKSADERAAPKLNVNKLSVMPSTTSTTRYGSKNLHIHNSPTKPTESHLLLQKIATPIMRRRDNILTEPGSNNEDVAASKGKEVPCVKDHDSLSASSQCPTHVRSQSGWKPYKWLPGSQNHAVEILKAHLEPVNAGGPSLDPSRRSSQSSSRENSSSEQLLEKQRAEQSLIKLHTESGAKNKVTEPTTEVEGISNIDDDRESSVTDRHGDRRISVDSVNTAWKKDHARLFGTGEGDIGKFITNTQEVPLKTSKHLHKPSKSGDPSLKKGRKVVETTTKLLVETTPKLRSCLKGSKMVVAKMVCGSPHIVPASTSISEFEYRRIEKDSNSNLQSATSDAEKHELGTSHPAKTASARRFSFTSSGQVKSGIEIRVPVIDSENMLASPCSQEGVQILHTMPSPVHPRPDLVGKPVSNSNHSASVIEELPEAQVAASRPIQLPSGLSTDLLETDKSSPKFISTDENDSVTHISTQAELAKAHEMFKRELQSPIKYPTLKSRARLSDPDVPSEGIAGHDRAWTTPPDNLKGLNTGVFPAQSDDGEPLSTQAMVDAMSPFVISTIKKPSKFLNALTKPAAAIFGYMGWGSSSQDRGNPSTSQHVPGEGLSAPESGESSMEQFSAPAITFEPATDFRLSGLDMDTSEDEERGFGYDLSQPSEFARSSKGPKRGITTTSISEGSDYETTMKQERHVRDDQGRWARVTQELSQRTPSKMKLRSFSSPRQGGSLSQDGQRQTAVEQAIDEAGSFLGTWDVEGEIRKMKASETGSGEGSGSAARTSSPVARIESN